jgi:alanine racemase
MIGQIIMFDFFQKLFNRVSYKPLIEVRVFKDNILHNLSEYQTHYPRVKFAPVLKSNAYGHGLVPVAKILDNENIAFLTVDSFFEALVLRREAIKSRILILGYATIEQITKSRLDKTSFTIIDLEQLRNISNSLTRPVSFHLKIDTGMHRQGILPVDLTEAIQLIKNNSNIILEGVCSHFADADGFDSSNTQTQIKTWNKITESIKPQFSTIKYFHISNTAGAYYLPDINVNVGRVGIGLYGFNTAKVNQLNLKPALELTTIITGVKTIPKGAKVGYNNTYTAEKEIKIATIPVGYNEGLDTRLSNQGFVKINNIFCPIIGRISMNMSSIDVTDVRDIALEDEVVVISKNPADKNSIENIIKICASSRYEAPVRIPQHLRRIII